MGIEYYDRGPARDTLTGKEIPGKRVVRSIDSGNRHTSEGIVPGESAAEAVANAR